MDDIELSKENLRPLRSGRIIDCLVNSINSRTELESRKAEFEAQRIELSGVELLDAYYDYIFWIEQNYGCTDETVLKSVLEDCLEHFFKLQDRAIFLNDKKLLSIFLKHTSMCNNPLEFFRSAYMSGFFKKLAQFFIEWSFHYEVTNDMNHAIKVLQGGKNKKAQPLENILEAIEKLNERKNEYGQNPSIAPSGNHRQAFNQLKVRAGHAAPTDRTNNVIVNPVQNRGLSQQAKQPAASSSNQNEFCIPEDNIQQNTDDDDEERAPVNLPFEKQAVPQSIKGNENMIKPGKWTENSALKQQAGKSGKIKEGFKVLNEGSAKPKKAVEKVVENVDYSAFSWSKLGPELYSAHGEMSFEEIRYLKYQAKLLELKERPIVKMEIPEEQVIASQEPEEKTVSSKPQQEEFKVPVKAIKIVEQGNYSMFSWCKLAPQIFSADGEISLEEIRYKLYQKKIMELKEKQVEKMDEDVHVERDASPAEPEFVVPEKLPERNLKSRDEFEALESVDSPKGKLISPTELLDMTVDHNHYKTLDFTASNFRTEDFSPNLGSTPQVNRTKVTIIPAYLSPVIEVSYKSSSSSGAYTTSTTQHETNKSMPPEEIYDYPFRLKSIKFMLKSIQNPIENRPGFRKETKSLNFKRNFFYHNSDTSHNYKMPFLLKIGEHSFISTTKISSIIGLFGLDMMHCQRFEANNVQDNFLVRLLEDGDWDFYIRHEILERSQTQNNSPLIGLFTKEVHFYNDCSASIEESPDCLTLSDHELVEYPFISAFYIHELISLIERLHTIKIVCGNFRPNNILVKKIVDLPNNSSNMFEFLNLSGAADLNLIPENYLSFKRYQLIDWIGLLDTVCWILHGRDVSLENVDFKINLLGSLTGSGVQYKYTIQLGEILAEMFKQIIQNDSLQIDLTQHKEALMKFISLERFTEIELRMFTLTQAFQCVPAQG